ncbi:MAG: hypothetical protein H6819_05910 [Phycisphaerales bacterium]|nr:hypothetical protein [Phycisphaerales bacterium]MCB9858644.1 hypothetical protein [Phycisphaerales bacterium]
MVVRFAFPTEEFRAWGQWAWHRAALPTARRARQKAVGLRQNVKACSVRGLVPLAIAIIAVCTATHALTPVAVGVPEPRIDVADFVAAARRSIHAKNYAWLTTKQRETFEALSDRIAVPVGYERVILPAGSFGEWLRNLPAGESLAPVLRANGRTTLIPADDPNLAVTIQLQPHTNALGAAGMMVRLRAEHCWGTKSLERSAFHFTSGQRLSWRAWANGVRALAGESGPRFEMTGMVDDSRDSFCAWIETQLQFTSCESLLDDTRKVDDGTIAPGDLLLRGGRDAHVLIVLDAAVDGAGRVAVLLGSGSSPAGTFHVLRASYDSPWFVLTSPTIDTGIHGRFDLDHLRRWAR